MPLVLIGLIFNIFELAMIGVIFFGLAVVFQLVTLPVEFNASRRAMAALKSEYLLEGDEVKGARKTLSAAAMTYVAALFVSLMQFLRLFIMVAGGRRRD